MNLAVSASIVMGILVSVAPFAGADAQKFPTKPLTLVVGVPPGGSADFLSRTLAEGMTKRLCQRVVVENRPGATSAIATRQVARAPADGYTMVYNAPNMAV